MIQVEAQSANIADSQVFGTENAGLSSKEKDFFNSFVNDHGDVHAK